MSTSPFLSGEDNPLPSVTGHPEWTYSILKEPNDLPTHIVSSKKLTKMVPKIDSKDETWYLGIKRLHRWFNIEGNPPQAPQPKVRFWCLVVARPRARHLTLCTFFTQFNKSTFSGSEYQDKSLRPEWVAAVLKILSTHYKKRPSKIMIMCAPGGIYRPASANHLVAALQPLVPMTIIGMGCDEIPHGKHSSVTSLYPPNDEGLICQWIGPNCIALMAKLRDGLMINSGESLENDGKTVPVGENFFSTFSLSLPCARPRISCAILWSFYFACKQFHEERVWLTFSNYELIKVTLENGTTSFVMVAGHTDYEGRGAYFFHSVEDVRKVQSSKHAMQHYRHRHDCLQFLPREEVSFQTHDHVAELGLPLANNDVNFDVFPMVYSCDCPLKLPETGEMVHHIMHRRNNRPTVARLVDLCDLLRAVTTVAQTPQLAYRPDGFSGLRYANGSQVVSVNGPNPFQCEVEIILITPMMMEETDVATLSIHEKDKCNFCNVPRTEGQKLMGCGRCKYVYYCGKRCQGMDFKRHKKECKEMAVRMKLEKKEKKKEKKKKKKKKKKKSKKNEEEEEGSFTGVRVRLVGLKNEQLNGMVGLCGTWHEDAERYEVTLDGIDGASGKKVRVKPVNLHVL